jgi:hypothetical protein
LEQLNEIKELQKQLYDMEQQVGILKLSQEKAYLNDYPSPPYDDASTPSQCSDSLEERIQQLFGFDDEKVAAQPQENQLIAQSNQCQVFVNTKPGSAWTLHVKNGNMVVETCIQSHSDLLKNLEHILCDMKTSVPKNVHRFSAVNKSTIAALSAIAWKRYGKTRFEVLTHCSPIDLNNPNAQLARVNSLDDLVKQTMFILHEYFNCQHFIQFSVYRPMFIQLFRPKENGPASDILNSPAVMSLCGTLCLYACKHLGKHLSFDSLTDYALYFFERTKELLEDRFDECSLDVMCAYTFLGTHKIKVKQDSVGLKYIDMARRIYDVLEPQYDHKSAPGEYVFIQRIYRLIHQADIISDIHYHMKHPYPKYNLGPVRFFKLMDSSDEIEIMAEENESPEEKSYIHVRKCISDLRTAIKTAAGNASSETLPLFVSDISHKIEMAERHWYRHCLPKEFQLTLPLFDDKVTDIDFFTRLEKECGNERAYRLLPVIAVYNEYLIMARSYIPPSPEEMEEEAKSNFFDIDIPDSGDPLDVNVDEKWKKVLDFIQKYREISPIVQGYQGTQQELIDGLIRVIHSQSLKFDMPLTHVAVCAAFNMVRLLQFLASREYTCFLDMRWLLNTWEILLRAARFKYQQANDEALTLDRIRANLYILLDIVRTHVLNARFDTVKDIHLDLSRQLEETFKAL